ncbi:hypothetical protein D5H75_28525 [Bailinhaonella thermotolerans]|uniref:Uncharacterized protein n=2 Tax=Bailinhaonella thermotolerans TaxID=1070861 RepID=A0A3A4ADA2_9ACTN|nr:hypothetical protein D5H75_28525 [Bailinhaonella thermotolerans]
MTLRKVVNHTQFATRLRAADGSGYRCVAPGKTVQFTGNFDIDGAWVGPAVRCDPQEESASAPGETAKDDGADPTSPAGAPAAEPGRGSSPAAGDTAPQGAGKASQETVTTSPGAGTAPAGAVTTTGGPSLLPGPAYMPPLPVKSGWGPPTLVTG